MAGRQQCWVNAEAVADASLVRQMENGEEVSRVWRWCDDGWEAAEAQTSLRSRRGRRGR